MISWVSFRHILAIVHLNMNLMREQKKLQDGSIRVSVNYPTFKNGEAIVKYVRVNADFSKHIFSVNFQWASPQLPNTKYLYLLHMRLKTALMGIICFWLGCFGEIFETLVAAIANGSLIEIQKDQRQKVPAPMNTMLEKESGQEAIEKHRHRRLMPATAEVPATTEVPATETRNQCCLHCTSYEACS